MNLKRQTNQYGKLLGEIKSRILAGRCRTFRAVNRELVSLYWDIGRMIVERQHKYGWGKSVVERLATYLRKEFPGVIGYSRDNLWRMRMFYLAYKDHSKLAQLVPEIPCGQNILILQKTKTPAEQEYYIKAVRELGWSRNVLLNQIKAGAYRLGRKLEVHNFPKALPGHLAEQAEESIKNIYSLDFLGITRLVFEKELERRIVEKAKDFMLELGAGFSFIGNQYRLELEGTEYFVDLLFFNRRLKCLVAIELKTGKFRPEYAGKMDFYLQLLNDRVRLKDENPSVGIILCADKSRVTVEYALRGVRNPVGVAEYRLTKKLPVPFRKILPSESEFRRRFIKEIRTNDY